jgi:hypothetical protein
MNIKMASLLFLGLSNIRFHANRCSGSTVITCAGQTGSYFISRSLRDSNVSKEYKLMNSYEYRNNHHTND